MRKASNNTTEDPLHIAIIGSGTAGLACAMTALERGACVTLIEHRDLGGTSLSSGHFPIHVLYRAAQTALLRSKSPFDAAISASKPSIDPDALLGLRDHLVTDMREQQIETLGCFPHFKLMEGEARFLDQHKLIVRLNDDSRKLSFRKVKFDRCLISSGGMADVPQIIGLFDTPFWTATEALRSASIPARLAVVGSSVAALELAQAFARLGSKVTILTPDAVLFADHPEMNATITNAFQSEGITVQTGTQVSEVSFEDGEFALVTDHGEVRAERMLIEGESMPNTHSLCLDFVAMELTPDGHIIVDDHLRTNVEYIYAAGSCTNLSGSSAVSEAAGRLAAINMIGGGAALDISIMPTAIFTDPPMAMVGLSEAQALDQGLETVSRTLPLDNVPGALSGFESGGFIKMVAEDESLRLLGVQVVAPQAGELIQAAAFAMRAQMSVQDVADQLFPAMTMVEGLNLCARLFSKDVQ